MRAPSRDVTPHWIRPVTDRLSPTITTLVILNAVLFSAFLLVKQLRVPIQDHLALTPYALSGGEPWQLLSSLFVHLDPISFLFNLIGLWFVGATIERQLGRTRFLAIFFVPALLGNLTIAGVTLLTRGAELYSGFGLAVLAMFVAFGRIYDRTPARILGGLVLEARTLTLILIGFALFADIMRGSLPALGGDVVAILAGYVVAGGRGDGLRELFSRFRGGGGRSKPSRRRFSVVEGGRQEDRRTRYLN
jgi:membrane associated rhomboid family serine protease